MRSRKLLLQWTSLFAILIIGASALITGGTASAEPTGPSAPTEIARLIADVARADQRLADLGAAVDREQEAVQKSLVDVESARTTSEKAQRDSDKARSAVQLADARITAAQNRFDEFATSMYINGPSDSVLTAVTAEDLMSSARTDQTFSIAFAQARAELERTRRELADQESAAKLAQSQADQAAQDARSRFDHAVQKLTGATAIFAQQQVDIDRAVADLRTARATLDQARLTQDTVITTAGSPSGGLRSSSDSTWDAAPAPTARQNQWDTAVPATPSANLSDPVAIINTVLQISASSAEVTASLGRQFLTKIGILAEPAATVSPGTSRVPRVYGQQAVEFVIRRGMSQRGVPYSWGGGNASGATRGIDQGAGTVGFDCSGLLVYAFAGVGIALPKYSGSQYNLGRRVPVAQMQRGDLICYGPNGSQHVSMYLGQGQMLEAPFTGSQVRVAPVRTSGMTSHVVRLIEY